MAFQSWGSQWKNECLFVWERCLSLCLDDEHMLDVATKWDMVKNVEAFSWMMYEP